MAKKKTPPEFADYFSLFKELKNEKDRSVALILTAWLDDALGHFLRTRLIEAPTVLDNLFGVDRPLGTFSAKINAAYAFACISKQIHDDLNTIREIRNDFAHERGAISFRTRSFADRCKNLHYGQEYEEDLGARPAREKFIFTALLLTGFLIAAAKNPDSKFVFSPEREDKDFHGIASRLEEDMQ